MGLPEIDVARVRRWCDRLVPEHMRDQVRMEVDVADRHLTILECRPPWRDDFGPEWTRQPQARLRYTKGRRVWTLYWCDRNDGWHLYDLIAPSSSVAPLLDELDRDPTCIFFG